MTTCKSQNITAGYWIKETTEGKLEEIQPIEEELVIVIDFKGCARKVPVTKLKLETFYELVKNLGSTFWYLSATWTLVDIVFEFYKETNIKWHERDRRSDGKGVLTNVCPLNQPLPVEMKNFSALSGNKVLF